MCYLFFKRSQKQHVNVFILLSDNIHFLLLSSSAEIHGHLKLKCSQLIQRCQATALGAVNTIINIKNYTFTFCLRGSSGVRRGTNLPSLRTGSISGWPFIIVCTSSASFGALGRAGAPNSRFLIDLRYCEACIKTAQEELTGGTRQWKVAGIMIGYTTEAGTI